MKLKKLLKIVSLIDKDAAKYLKENVDYPEDTTNLLGEFTWKYTPQGYDYWEAIEHKVYKIEQILKDRV